MIKLKKIIKKRNTDRIILYCEREKTLTSSEVDLIIKEYTSRGFINGLIRIIISIKKLTDYKFSKKNKDDLTKTLCETGYINSEDCIYEFATIFPDLTQENKDDLTGATCRIGNAPRIIYKFARDVEGLTQENKNDLTNAICKTYNAEYIYRFARDVEGLTQENKNDLTNAICRTYNAKYIYKFARDVEGLTQANKNGLTNAICRTYNAKYIYKFACDVEGLTQANKNDLTYTIRTTNDAEYIYRFACDFKLNGEIKLTMIMKIFHIIKDFEISETSIIVDNNFENIMLCKQLKNKIMESKDKLLIAKYIILANDIELMNKIFGDISLFEDFCKINENSINISNGEIVKFFNKFKFNYVDANIDYYLKSDIPNATLQ